jgi:hypothetical protein
MATDVKNKEVDTSKTPSKILSELMKMQQTTLSPYQKGVNKKLEEIGSAHAEEAIQQGVNPMQISSQAGLDGDSLLKKLLGFDVNADSPQKQAGTMLNNTLSQLPGISQQAQPQQQSQPNVPQAQSNTPSLIAQQPTNTKPSSDISPLRRLMMAVGSGMAAAGGHTDVMHSLLNYVSEQKKNQNLDPNQQIKTLSNLNKALADSGLNDYQGEIGAEGKTYIKSKPTAENQMVIALKDQQQQDKLENNAIQRMSSIRGDTSIARIETQRDASIQAYNIIESLKKENREPTQVEYYDLLGQLWKARTGASPTDQAIKDLDASTFHGKMNKMVQYFTGKPTGITTKEILDNVQSFAKKSGEQADKLHAGYMSTHVIKPKGLSEERWKNIISSQRGLSFGEATSGQEEQSVPQEGGMFNGEKVLKVRKL